MHYDTPYASGLNPVQPMFVVLVCTACFYTWKNACVVGPLSGVRDKGALSQVCNVKLDKRS